MIAMTSDGVRFHRITKSKGVRMDTSEAANQAAGRKRTPPSVPPVKGGAYRDGDAEPHEFLHDEPVTAEGTSDA
jgi:hypothetical protein